MLVLDQSYIIAELSLVRAEKPEDSAGERDPARSRSGNPAIATFSSPRKPNERGTNRIGVRGEEFFNSLLARPERLA